MIRERTDRQVVTSGAQIDVMLARLPAALVMALVEARETWRAQGRLPVVVTADLLAGLETDVAARWDAIFVRRAREELRLRS